MKYKLGDICSRLSSGKGISAKMISDSGKYPVYGGNGLRGYTEKSNFAGECAIIGRQGAFCGNVRFFSGEAYMTEHAVVVCADENNNTRYLSYLLDSMKLGRLSGQSAQPGLSVKVLAQQEVDMPPLEQQKKVANILSVIEDKIELNNSINKNLADQIQSIYNNEFDPCTHTPSGVLADICSYSSDRIPVSRLSLSTYFSTENMQPNKMGYVDATSLPSITQTTGCHKGDVLISNIRPYFKKIVYVTDDSCGCSTDVLCFVPKEDQYSAFLFGTLYMDRFFDYMIAGSKGTKMPRGDKQQIMNYPVVLPDKKSLDLFNGLIVPMLDQIATNRAESNRLVALRDALLPKLMSGELDVSELDL